MLDRTVREAARRFGSRTALVTPSGRRLGYADLDHLSDRVAAGLQREGVGPGDRVALVLGAGAEFVIAYAAAAKVGAITAGVNKRLAPPEREAILHTADPALVIATRDLAPPGAVVTEPDDDVEALHVDGPAPEPLPPDPDRVEAIVFTSGTTGAPKGAVFCERQLEAISTMDAGTDWDGGPPLLAAIEPVHVGFMTKLPWYLRKASRVHQLRTWRAAEALEITCRERMPAVGGISAQVALMLRLPDFDEYDSSAIQVVIAGGGPSSPSLIREARERFGAAYSVRYSSTESGGLGTLTTGDMPDDLALHTVGRPRPGIDLSIRNPDGDVGEVWLRSPSVMAGYWRNPEATSATLVDGWLRTGDHGHIDEHGCLHLAGRAREMFVRGGYNVWPQEVEAVLRDHPAVAEVCVAPRADDVMGWIGVAHVVTRGGAVPPTLEGLRAFASDRLARHKLPEDLRMLDDLPRTAMGKVDRVALTDGV